MIYSQLWLIDNQTGAPIRYVEGLWSASEWTGPIMEGPHNFGNDPVTLYQSHHIL